MKIAVHRKANGNNNLPGNLLPRGQTQRPLLGYLDVVIQEAHQHTQQRHCQQSQHEVLTAVPSLGVEQQGCDRNSHNHHQAAHGRRALLCLMCLWSQVVNGLPELQLSQPGNKLRSKDKHNGQ